MTDRTHITNAGRRAFLGAGAALTVAALTGSAAVAFQPDPIFAAIEAHKAAVAATLANYDAHTALERELPADKRRSRVDAWEEAIVPTDDPRWIETERNMMRCYNAEEDAACALVSEAPATLAGVLALLQYANTADTDGMAWPAALEDGKTRSWHYFLVEMLADALPAMVQA